MVTDEHDIQKLRHSAAHLLAHAVIELFPLTKLAIGPATKEGFFYDMLPEKNFKEQDLVIITQKMEEIVQKNLTITHTQISKNEARDLYKNNPFKLELIDHIPGDVVGIARQGNFYDLCKGGHVENTGQLCHFRLLTIAGSYWRADATKQQLQRIYGVVFFTGQELVDFEKHQEELQQYDHRTLGKRLDMFSFSDEAVGFPFFHPKGKLVFILMQQYMRELWSQANYVEVSTPTLLHDDLWKRSGHYEHYHDHMYFLDIENSSYAIKPMNCPGAILIYKTRPRSYRELPLKFAEFGHVHRHELSGVLHGLMRVRAFTQDDAHIFCTRDLLGNEIILILTLMQKMLKKFGFVKSLFVLATKPKKSMGDQRLWEDATCALKDSLENLQLPYIIKEGEGAFYGPKIELHIEDSLKRNWQCGTIQIDFFQSENFDISFISSSGKRERPVLIHQALYGSLERFFAILLEHYKGHLPFWLAPIQVCIMTITNAEAQIQYAKILEEHIKMKGIRVMLDEHTDPIQAKIKHAQQEKIPLMLIIGKQEVERRTISIRYADGSQELHCGWDSFFQKLVELVSL